MKTYGDYSDADLNDWQMLPLVSNVLTSSAFGAWLMRRDERREEREKSVIDKIRAEIIELRSKQNVGVLECLDIIDKYKAESEK